MPYAKIETNLKLDSLKEQELLKAASGFFAALLEKSEEHVMVSVSHETAFIFDKNSDPAAYVELKSMAIKEEICTDLSKEICGFLNEHLDILPNRIYIEFSTINGKMFGCNNKTF
jgi:phenylpyruvate tautomerase